MLKLLTVAYLVEVPDDFPRYDQKVRDEAFTNPSAQHAANYPHNDVDEPLDAADALEELFVSYFADDHMEANRRPVILAQELVVTDPDEGALAAAEAINTL